MTGQPTSRTATVDDAVPPPEESSGRPRRADAKRNYERLVAAARDVFAQQDDGRVASHLLCNGFADGFSEGEFALGYSFSSFWHG